MEPNLNISMMAVVVATVANFIFGAIWYMPLFGKAWATEMKIDMTGPKPPTSVMVRGMALMVIGNFLMAYVLAHDIAVWNPLTWGHPEWVNHTPMQFTFAAAFFTWLGFYLPQDLSKMAWENKSMKLFFINTGHHFLSLYITALILIFMS
ncbi:MAG TPA: DUF1761 domain-containing protein [Bacteroidia bacterium]|nr:DUF1761 domain-containing protein [Bacteroidia bacterium]